MLSDEERKAINQLKADTSFYDYELKNGNYIYELFKIEVYKKDIDVILNLIEKQSKEIEELKEQCKEVVCIPEGTCFMLEPKDINKKWKDKIKAKIEEVKDGTFDAKIVLQSLLEKE